MKAISLWQSHASYLAGVLHGDAWCTSRTIGLRAKDLDFVQEFSKALKDVFGVCAEPQKDERGYWLVRIGNKTGRFDKAKGFEPSSEHESKAWLRGMFDSEGNAQLWRMKHLSANSCHRRVAFYSTEMGTLEKCAKYLTKLGIPHSIRSTKNSETHKGSKVVYELRILRREGFEKFADLIGSSIERKRERLKDIVESYKQSEGFCARGGKAGTSIRIQRRDAGGVLLKAISIWQPFASLIMLGSKKIETRHWPVHYYRGPLLIHAAKRQNKKELAELSLMEEFHAAFHKLGGTMDGEMQLETLFNLPLGCLLGTVDLVDCKCAEDFTREEILVRHYVPGGESWMEFDMGDFSRGRFGWVLENPKPFNVPIQYQGSQGFFKVPDHIALRAQCYRSTEGDAIAL